MLSSNEEALDLTNYEIISKIFKGKMWKYYQIYDLLKEELHIIKIYKNCVEYLTREEMLDFSRQVYIISRLEHPAFLKFKGYSLVDFKDRTRPLIALENASNGRLKDLLYVAKDSLKDYKIKYKYDLSQALIMITDETKKLIVLYGIASGMEYLHSHNILHRSLKLSSIFLDDNLYPKILGLDIAKEIQQRSAKINDEPQREFKLKGNIRYLAPEILSNLEYSKASDVYSFSLIMYELITNEKPFKSYAKKTDLINDIVNKGTRPKIRNDIPLCYRNLIEKCWSQDLKKRPTFKEIVSELRNNQDFISKDINKKEYYKYIDFIDKAPVSFKKIKHIQQIDDILESKTRVLHKSDEIIETRKSPDSFPFIDLKNYEFNGDGAAKKLTEDIYYSYKKYSKEITNFTKHEIVNFVREINIISRLDHPAILKFVGYSPVDDNDEPKPVVMTEFIVEKNIEKFNINADFEKSVNIDDTQKLIVFYGIASGMSYLHSHDILHCDLKKTNIVYNIFDHPKIIGFDIAKEINSSFIEEENTIKGTPAYIAPEVYINKKYCKASDVYSFSLIMYELITGEKPYSTMISPKQIKEKVAIENYRPPFNKPILKCYQNLIERCWSANPKDRPTFHDIVNELKTNPDFITDTIDEVEFKEYVEYIDKFNVTFQQTKPIQELDDILKLKIHTFKNITTPLYLCSMYETEKNNLSFGIKYVDLKEFGREHETFRCSFYEINIRQDRHGPISFQRKPLRIPKFWYKHELINFSRELNVISQLNHPSILEFY